MRMLFSSFAAKQEAPYILMYLPFCVIFVLTGLMMACEMVKIVAFK
jgi:hypothetical protein